MKRLYPLLIASPSSTRDCTVNSYERGSEGRSGGQKPGFLPEYFVTAPISGEKPGFFGRSASRTVLLLYVEIKG